MATISAIVQELASASCSTPSAAAPALVSKRFGCVVDGRAAGESNFERAITEARDVFLKNLSNSIRLKRIAAKTFRRGNGECDTGEMHFHMEQEFENVESAVTWSKIIAGRLLNALGEDAFGLPLLRTYPKVEYLKRGRTTYLEETVRLNMSEELGIPLCCGEIKIPLGAPSFNEYYTDLAEKHVYVGLISTFCHEELHHLQERIGLFSSLDRRYFHISTKGHRIRKQRNSDVKEGIVVESLPQFIGCLAQSKLFRAVGLDRPGIHEGIRCGNDINNMVANSIFEMGGAEEYDFIQSTNRLAMLARENIPAAELAEWASHILRGAFSPTEDNDIVHGVGGAMAAIIHFCRGDPAATLKQLLKIGSYEQMVMEVRDSLPYAISAIRDPQNWETVPSQVE